MKSIIIFKTIITYVQLTFEWPRVSVPACGYNVEKCIEFVKLPSGQVRHS